MASENKQLKTLILFNPIRLEDMLEKGNVWYVRHYEAYFDEVYVVYLSGGPHQTIKQGKTTLVSLGTGSGPVNGIINLILAPYRLYRFARKIKPTNYLTADLVFSWWTGLLVILLLRVKIVLMPVCMPEQIYNYSGKSVSGILPIWLEKIFIRIGLGGASRVITSRNWTGFIGWLSSLSYVKNKLKIIDVLVEELPPVDFYESSKIDAPRIHPKEEFYLLYVGRLHKEKRVGDLIRMMTEIQKREPRVRLRLVGDGPERENLENFAVRAGVREKIEFLGFKSGKELLNYYRSADVFVSTVTGTSLREAALCGLPVVAYDIDWLKGLLTHEENALLVEFEDTQGLATQVLKVLSDRPLKEKITANLRKFAAERWDIQKVAFALKQIFES